MEEKTQLKKKENGDSIRQSNGKDKKKNIVL